MSSAEIDGETERDEWGDADFEIPDGHPLIAPNPQSHATTTDDGEDDWDIEMSFGRTGGAKLSPGVVHGRIPSIASQMETSGLAGAITRLGAGGKPVEFDWDDFTAPPLSTSPHGVPTQMVSVVPRRPPDALDKILDWDLELEGTTTIKLPADRSILIPKPSLSSISDFTPTATAPYTPLQAINSLPKLPLLASDMEEDFEADFDLPGDLSKLSLRPLHQSTSKCTVGSPGDPWVDYASMSTTTHSSETSSLGFGHHASPSTSAWSGGTETDEDDYAFLDGVVVPDGMFDKENTANLSRILETKKKTPTASKPKHALNLAHIENDDFLDGLVLDDSADLSPSKLNNRTPPRAGNRPPSLWPVSSTRSPSTSPVNVRRPSRTPALNRARSPPLSGVSLPIPRGPTPGRGGATSPTPTRAAGALLTRLTISPPPPSFERKVITPSTSAPNGRWSQSGKVNGPRPLTTKRQAIRKGSLQSLVDSIAGVFSDTDTRGASKAGLDRHLIRGSTPRPIRPTLAPSYSSVTVTSTSRASYNAPTAASRARSALDMHDRDGAAFSDREGRGFGILSPDQQRWVVPTTRPNTPTQNTAAVRLQGFMRPAPVRPIAKNTFLNASTTSNSSTGSSWSNAAIAPSRSAPAPVRSFAAIVKSPPLPSPRVLSPTAISASKRPWAISSLANAKVTFPLPVGAMEVKRPRRPRAPSGIWGDGTELDALDDLDVDPTQERQFQVQAKGVNEGGTVKRWDKSCKGKAVPVGVRITNANAGPNGKVDLSKFKEPEFPKKRERERKPFITLHPPPVVTGSALLQVPGRISNTKRKRERGPPPPKRPNLIRNMNEVKSPKVVGDMSFNPKTLRWDGNEQILRDFDAAVASSSRPALITNLSGPGPSTPVNGQSSATTPKVVGSMLFDPVNMCWVHQLGDAFEEDPFAAIDELEKLDEEEEEGWGTIKVNPPPSELGTSVGSPPGPIHHLRTHLQTEASPARSFGRARAHTHHTQSASELESAGGSDRGSRMYSREEHERLAAGDIDEWDVSDELLRQCQEAEERHKAEVKGWVLPLARGRSQSVAAVVGFRVRGEDRTDRGWLHEIRAVAMKTYLKPYPT